MALKAIIHKATVQVSNLDENVYADHQLTLARHPSETDERMMVRLLVHALNWRDDPDNGPMEFAKDMFEPDEPTMWQKNHGGDIIHWIEVGQPEPKRILQAAGRSRKVSIYTFSNASPAWWSSISDQVSKVRHLEVWHIPKEHAEQLAALADKTMSIQITLQDGIIYVEANGHSVEVSLTRLNG